MEKTKAQTTTAIVATTRIAPGRFNSQSGVDSRGGCGCGRGIQDINNIRNHLKIKNISFFGNCDTFNCVSHTNSLYRQSSPLPQSFLCFYFCGYRI